MSEGGSSPRGSEASGFTSTSRMTDYSRLAESQASLQAPLPAELPFQRLVIHLCAASNLCSHYMALSLVVCLSGFISFGFEFFVMIYVCVIITWFHSLSA